jgi:D-aminopeptidase
MSSKSCCREPRLVGGRHCARPPLATVAILAVVVHLTYATRTSADEPERRPASAPAGADVSGREAQVSAQRPRARDLGIAPGVFDPGPLNAITDVDGVTVGHATLRDGDATRTGVTVIVPHPGNVFQQKVPGAVFVGNAFGKLAGSTQVDELGTIETPVALTNTLAVGAVVEGLVEWTLAQPGNGAVRSVNALVGETNDGGLNDIRSLAVRPAHVAAALAAARGGAVEEGSVGAGTGTRAFGWKGGIGTSSRRLPERYGGYTLGVLVQSNYGGVLTMDGVPIGKILGRYDYRPSGAPADASGDGSCMVVVATDAPLDARDLKRLAARAVFGLARTGSSFSNGSGDFAIAFSTAPSLRVRFGDATAATRTLLPTDGVSPLFQAALEATEEAVYNSLLRATPVSSRLGSAEALPVDRVREAFGRVRPQ